MESRTPFHKNHISEDITFELMGNVCLFLFVAMMDPYKCKLRNLCSLLENVDCLETEFKHITILMWRTKWKDPKVAADNTSKMRSRE